MELVQGKILRTTFVKWRYRSQEFSLHFTVIHHADSELETTNSKRSILMTFFYFKRVWVLLTQYQSTITSSKILKQALCS